MKNKQNFKARTPNDYFRNVKAERDAYRARAAQIKRREEIAFMCVIGLVAFVCGLVLAELLPVIFYLITGGL